MATSNKEIDYTNSEVYLKLKDRSIYGSSRVGVRSTDIDMHALHSPNYSMKSVKYEIGKRTYELNNHLGNVLSVISDKVIPSFEGGNLVGMLADVRVAQDYSPFGVVLSGRSFEVDGWYRFGFNGMEADNEIKGKGNSYTTEYRQYDPCLGRWLSIDPLFQNFPWQSPYAAFDNNPIYYKDPKGLAAEKHDEPGKIAKVSRIEKKFERRFEKWKKNNENKIQGTAPHEHYESFGLHAKGRGRSNIEKKWFHKYETSMRRNNSSTGWAFKTTVSRDDGVKMNDSGLNSLTVNQDLKESQGKLQINYNMAGAEDRLQIINPANGQILFDTKNLPQANRAGKVRFRQGSGQIINFNLGEGKTMIKIVVNPNEPVQRSYNEGSSVFGFNIVVNPTVAPIIQEGVDHNPSKK